MSSTASIGGLVSGIDTNTILDQLYQLSLAPVRRLEARQAELQNQSTAWSELEAKLLSLRTVAGYLADPLAFSVCTALVSHPSLVSASASASAVPGAYTFTVEALAQTHQLGSQGYADTDTTEVGSGTISIEVGDGTPTVIDVDAFTLAELRDAINAADAGVTATIINDGSDTTPYRLLLTSHTSGLDGEMEVTVSLAGGTAPTFNDLQAAQDAQIKLGSGAGAITVTSSSNTIKDAIQGVTLQLLDTDPTTTVTLTVSRDTAAIQTTIADFVASYNAIVDFFAEQFYYDPDTGVSGTLFGNYQLQSLQRGLSAALTYEVIGLASTPRALSDIGIRTLSTGKLTIDSTALVTALADQPEAVMRVFAAMGQASSSTVEYLSATVDTRPSGLEGWAVDITQAAREARVTAGVAQTAALVADETITILDTPIFLTAGMTQAEVIAEINSYSDQTGIIATATDADGEGTGNYLTLTRVAYGSAYHVETVSTSSNQGGSDTSGIGTVTVTEESPEGESGTGTGDLGLDVEGTIGGEAATGAGQRLTAQEGDPKGLALLVTAAAPGSYGTIVFTVGAAQAAFRETTSATDTVNGTVATAQSYLEDRITDIGEEMARLQAAVDREQQRLREAFARMEMALSQFQSQSQFLSSQIAQLQANAAMR